MKRTLATLALGFALVNTVPVLAQDTAPAASPQQQETAAQRRQKLRAYFGTMLDNVHRHPDQIDANMDKLGQIMINRGRNETDVNTRLQGVYAVCKQVSKMDDASYQAQKKSLIRQCMMSLRKPQGSQ